MPSATATQHRRYDVFLSHNSRDKPIVERIARQLKGLGVEPWLDVWYLPAGVAFSDELGSALRAAGACAFFVGAHGPSDWALEELRVAMDRAAKDRGFRLFLVLLAGLAEPFDPTSLPPFLTTRTWVDLRHDDNEPHSLQKLVNATKGIPPGPNGAAQQRPETCPYRGLVAFDEHDAPFFFGRTGDIQRLVEKLKGTHFVAVTGTSGSGKSSLVRAGLLPALRRGELSGGEHWDVRIFTPGAHPLTSLAAQLVRLDPQRGMGQTLDELGRDIRSLHLAGELALAGRSSAARVLWVVDQFEEVFTLCENESERRQFLDNLMYAAGLAEGRNHVLLTLRADFYARCAAYPELSARVAAQQFLVSSMGIEDLRQAIEEPARRVGLEFESGLVETILQDILNQPGALPLLQHALLELWSRREGWLLGLGGYRASGGVAGAIAQRADAIYASFSPQQQDVTRRVLLRLTQPGEGTEDTRRRVPTNELISDPEERKGVDVVVRALVEARLLTTSGEESSREQWVEVAHEALIRGWGRLRDWIDADREGLRLHRRVTESAQEWQRLGRDDGLLYRGFRLAEARAWWEHNDQLLNRDERDFLQASVALRRREQRTLRRRQLVTMVLIGAVLLISCVAIALFVLSQKVLLTADMLAKIDSAALEACKAWSRPN